MEGSFEINFRIMLSSSLRSVLTAIASKPAGKIVPSVARVAAKNESSLSMTKVARAPCNSSDVRNTLPGHGYNSHARTSSKDSGLFSTAAAGDCHMTGF